MNSAGIFFAPVTEELGISVGQLSVYMTLMGIFMTIAIPFAGKAISRFNIKVILTVAFIISLSAVAAMSLYNAVWQWYVSGVIIGICSGFSFAVTVPIVIGNWFYKKNGLAIGISSAFAGVGGAILTPTVSKFINQFGWRRAYVMLAVIVAIIVLPFTLFVISFKPEDKGLKPYGYQEKEDVQNRNSNVKATGVPPMKAYKSFAFILLFIGLGTIAFLAGYSQLLPSYALSANLSVTVGATMVSFYMFGNIIAKLSVGALSDKFGITVVGMIYDAFGSYIPTFVLGIILSIIATILVWLVFSLTKRLEWEE